MHERRIGVLMGGLARDRAASLASPTPCSLGCAVGSQGHTGQAVLGALRARGRDAHPIPVDRDLDQLLRRERIDVAFIALRGRYGEDGRVQGLLETMGIPYTGSDVLASALAMNKVRAKQIFRLSCLPTPPGYTLAADLGPDPILVRHADFGFPVMVKPVSQGSPLGVSRAANADELVAACERAALFDSQILVERHIDGQEVAVAVLDDRAIGAAEVDAADSPGPAGAIAPLRLGAERCRGVLRLGAMAHRALGCSGATLVDLIVSPTGNEYVLEVDTVPDLTRGGLAPRIAAAAGLSLEDLVEAILLGAGRRGLEPCSPAAQARRVA